MKLHSKSAAEALAESPLAGLLDQARLLDRMNTVVAHFSQETAGDSTYLPRPSCVIQGRTVIITLGTPSQAAKMRQRTAALQQLLQDCDPELTGIRIRLQASRLAAPLEEASFAGLAALSPQPPDHAASLAAALRFAEDLSKTLHDSPLRRSAQRLRATVNAKLESGH
jgi:hypothetical protein